MIKVLELFSGTGSVGKVCKQIGWETLSIDIDGRADIKCDILEWDYTAYPPKYFAHFFDFLGGYGYVFSSTTKLENFFSL